MYAQICFPLFDTRFARQEAGGEAGEKPAPLWLYGDPPPGIPRIGNFGAVDKSIPPLPYARCTASDVMRLQPLDPEQETLGSLKLSSIQAVADQNGHARISAWFRVSTAAGTARLSALVEAFASVEVAVRHPARHDIYVRIAEAGPDLADLYARESKRTALEYQGDYVNDWVHAGRPFLILADTERSGIDLDPTAVDVPVSQPQFSGRAHFLPWSSGEGEFAFPVWYLDAPRGGDAWVQPAEALEELNARYEELVLASMIRAKAEAGGAGNANYEAVLEAHTRRVSFLLRKQRRHGVDLKAALRLLSDYDRSVLSPRQPGDFAEALVERVGREIGEDIRFRVVDQSFSFKGANVTVNNYSGNVINYGVMTDNTINVTNNLIKESAAAPELKTQLEALREPLLQAAKELPEAEARNLLKDYESFTEMALRENPPKQVVKEQGNNILETVKKVAAFATPVGTILGVVLKLVGI